MEEKRRTIRHELPGDDAWPSQSLGEASMQESRVDEPAERSDTFKLFDDNIELGDDGRVQIDCGSRLTRTLSLMYGPTSKQDQNLATEEVDHEDEPSPPGYEEAHPRLNVLIQVVGSRGDVQPFIALGNEIQRLGFRVRLATHDTFATFVRDSGLEFYPVGGDPAELMAYMVRNPGLIPSFRSLQAGDVQKKREMVEEMLEGLWDSCLQPDDITGDPFVADAIIANPPAFAHIHCAEALGIPVHIMFTMPWTSTSAFPHPLVNLTNNDGNPSMANYVSYAIVEYLTWQGLGDVINRWRSKLLDLEHVAMFDGPLLAERLRIPFTYCWSPSLVGKPADWGAHIDICGFFFRNAPSYSPPEDLARFLVDGTAPVYIGFGSIVLDNPERVIATVLDAVRRAGVRAIISKGWSNLAGTASDDIYWIGDCPHEWLFGQVAAVVHHGGAGTTACGLKNGVPTIVVPFFGDQPFWGDMVANAGAGPKPIPYKQLDSQKLADGIAYCLTPQAKSGAQKIAEQMSSEQGVRAAARSWLSHLPKQRLQCDLIPSEPVAWVHKKGRKCVKLSKVAAQELVSSKTIEAKDLDLYHTKPFSIDVTRWDPVSGGSSALLATAFDMTDYITGIVTKPMGEYRHEQRRRERERRREDPNQSKYLTAPESDGRSSPTTSHTSETTSFDEHGKPKPRSMAAKMAGASLKSFGMIAPTAVKGLLVDIPLAVAEGLKAVPQHFGTNVRDHGPVTDMTSGAVVAGKTLAWGLVDGLSDLVMEPIRGASRGGALGAVKGVGAGAISLVTKSGAGVFGVYAYPSAGIAKSIRGAVYRGRKKLVASAKYSEGEWLLSRGLPLSITADALVRDFKLAQKGRLSTERALA